MKVLVVDDHALIRDALRGVLKELKDDASVVEAADSRQALRLTDENPDLGLVLLDLNLPDRSGFDVLAELRERHPAISVVVLSALNDRDSVARALDLGATGFIPKSASREVMLSALRLVFSGASTFRRKSSAPGSRPRNAACPPQVPGPARRATSA